MRILSLGESADVLARQIRLRRRLKNTFHPGLGRLARGGLLPRIVDALFSLSFFMRGRVPAASAAAAELDYFHMRAQREVFTYYGRVVRQNHWTVLQYWFFYCYNNWRSGFGGVNDHESDWEMISVYLYEDNGHLVPEWVAYASHDFHGDDLRRRWDDAGQLNLEDGHPVVYAGAGSHASYFQKGEYQAEVDLDLPGWLDAPPQDLEHVLDPDPGPTAGRPVSHSLRGLRARGRHGHRARAYPQMVADPG